MMQLVLGFIFIASAHLTFAQTKIPLLPIEGTPFYAVEMRVGDFGTAKMIVDTGVAETLLFDWFVSERKIPNLHENLPPQTLRRQPAPLINRAKIQEVQVGDRVKRLNDMAVMVSAEVFKKLKIAGLINPQNFFHGQEVLMDFPNKLLVAGHLKEHLKDRERAFTTELSPCSAENDHKYLIRGAMEENRFAFHIKTGASRAALRPHVAGVFGMRDRVLVEDAPFRLGKIKTQLNMEISEPQVSCTMADATLANDFLKNYSVYFSGDRKEFRLYQ